MKREQFRELLRQFVKKGIRMKYRNSVLGIIWSLFEPLLSILVYVMVFGTLFHHRDMTFALYVSCGRLLYAFFSEGTQSANSSIRSNAEILRKVYVPQYLYPLSEILWHYVIFLVSLVVLIPFYIAAGRTLNLKILWVLPALVLLLILTTGVGLILSCCNVFFRDVEYIWRVLLMLIMYSSAIFYYPERILQSSLAFLLNLNPVYGVIALFRCGIFGTEVTAWMLIFTTVVSIISLIMGILLYHKFQRRFVLYV